MSALSILVLVLPLPLLFFLHELEDFASCDKWRSTHEQLLNAGLLRWRSYPLLGSLLEKRMRMSGRTVKTVALVELVLLLAICSLVLVGGPLALELWAAAFIAFGIHLLGHILRALLMRSYVPGTATGVLLLPYISYGLFSIHLVMGVAEMALLGIGGLLVAGGIALICRYCENKNRFIVKS